MKNYRNTKALAKMYLYLGRKGAKVSLLLEMMDLVREWAKIEYGPNWFVTFDSVSVQITSRDLKEHIEIFLPLTLKA